MLEPGARPDVALMRQRHVSTALAVRVSVVSIAGVIHYAADQEPTRLPQSGAGYVWLGLALVVTACALFTRAGRWHWIMRSAGVEHRRRDAAGLTLVGYMGNNVLPARGGELLKVGLLGARSPARHREVLGTVLTERLLDAGVLVTLFVALTWADVPGAATMDRPAAAAATALAVIAASIAVYVRLRRRGLFSRFAERIRPVAGASRQITTLGGVPLAAGSAVIWGLDGLTVMLVARALGLDLGLPAALAVLVLGSLAAAIPAAPGYVGTFDAAFLVGLHAAGVRGGDAVSVLLLTRFLLFVPLTVAGLGALVFGYGGLGAATRSRSTTPRPAARSASP